MAVIMDPEGIQEEYTQVPYKLATPPGLKN